MRSFRAPCHPARAPQAVGDTGYRVCAYLKDACTGPPDSAGEVSGNTADAAEAHKLRGLRQLVWHLWPKRQGTGRPGTAAPDTPSRLRSFLVSCTLRHPLLLSQQGVNVAGRWALSPLPSPAGPLPVPSGKGTVLVPPPFSFLPCPPSQFTLLNTPTPLPKVGGRKPFTGHTCYLQN